MCVGGRSVGVDEKWSIDYMPDCGSGRLFVDDKSDLSSMLASCIHVANEQRDVIASTTCCVM